MAHSRFPLHIILVTAAIVSLLGVFTLASLRKPHSAQLSLNEDSINISSDQIEIAENPHSSIRTDQTDTVQMGCLKNQPLPPIKTHARQIRLVEFHVDKYAQSSPELRPVYEVKEKMSNLRMELKRGYQVKLHYSFSGNYIDLSIENPLEIETKILFQMENKSVLPTSKSETTLSLGYPLSSSLRLASYYGFQKREFSMAGYKLLENNISTSLTGSTLVLEDSTQDNRIIVGLSWNH